MYDANVHITGVARLDGNTFRYDEKGYRFEVAVYNGFITVKTIAGDLEGVKADGIYPAALEMSHYVNFCTQHPTRRQSGYKKSITFVQLFILKK
jgi:hypothetical protein